MRDGLVHKRIAAACGASVFALSGVPFAALAQQAPTREQIAPPAQTQPTVAPHKRVDSEKVQDFAPCALDKSALRVTITSVNFTGPGGQPLAPQIQKVLQNVGPTVSGEAPIREVCDVRDAANSALRRAGYIASVQIVPQDLTSGALQLTVVTAHFADIRVHGDPGPYRALMDDRIKQLMALDPLNEMDAERILLLTGDVPGLDVRLSLRSAGTKPGEVIGDLTVSRVPYRVQANVNNYGSQRIGEGSAYARLEIYGLTHHADVTYLGLSDTFDTREQQVVQIGHTMGIGHSGDTLGGSFIYAKTRPDLGVLDLRTTSQVFNVEYYHPIVRTVSRDLFFRAGLDAVEQKTSVYGGTSSTILSLDKLRVGYGRLEGITHTPGLQGSGFTLSGNLEVRKGLTGLGASKAGSTNLSRLYGRPDATVVRFNLDTVVGLGPILSFAGAVRTQWTKDVLLNYEQFAVGNLTIGRGYDPGANTADKAVAWRSELRLDFARAHAMKGQGFVFYDSAHIWRNKGTSNIPDPENDRTLSSAGAGVRFTLPGRFIAEITYAKPLNKALTIDKAPPPPRLMFSLTTQFPSGY